MFERTVRDSTYCSFFQCILIRLGNNDVPFHQLRRTGRPVPPSRLVCAASAPRRITGVTAYQLPTLARMVKMRYGYFFFIILEVAAIGSEALVAPRNCISQNHDRVPTQQYRLVVEAPTTKQHVSSHFSLFCLMVDCWCWRIREELREGFCTLSHQCSYVFRNKRLCTCRKHI